MTTSAVIPRFYLYGEPHRMAELRFIHVESLDDRSRPSEWTIRPHNHAELNHVFHIAEGGGTMRAEERSLSFDAPCLITVPAGVIHGFRWQSESKGAVVTISSAYLAQLEQCDDALSALFTLPHVATLDAAESSLFTVTTERLMAELGWGAPGHRAAAEAKVLDLLVQTVRASGSLSSVGALPSRREAVLVARYRERIEIRFRLREPLSVHANALRTSETRLRVACSLVTGQSPMQVLNERTLLEAQRALLYSNHSVADVAEIVGFEDAAYFSRFFTRHMGLSPRAYRTEKNGSRQA